MNNYIRPSADVNFLHMAMLAARRGTCVRRRVGCVLVNSRNHIIATGYNGVASGMKHCIEHACPGANYPSGQGLEKCEAIHAEANALLQCRNVYDIATAYVTVSPCVHCVKLLLNTSCWRIVFADQYSHHTESMALWESGGRKYECIPVEAI